MRPLRALGRFLSERPRSPEWRKVRKAHLREESWCKMCGGNKDLQVHHIKPFHLYPELELDPENLITLCERRGIDDHLYYGHLGDWQKINPNIVVVATSRGPGVPAPLWRPRREHP